MRGIVFHALIHHRVACLIWHSILCFIHQHRHKPLLKKLEPAYIESMQICFMFFLLILPECSHALVVTAVATCQMGFTTCVVGGVNSCGACTCPEGNYYRFETPSEGCFACPTCNSGQYRSGCGGSSSGQCKPCGFNCGFREYSVGCTALSDGQCTPCEGCPDGLFRIGCTGISPGVCKSCKACPAGQTMVGCAVGYDGYCATCATCSNIPFPEYVVGCSAGYEGDCSTCDTCPTGKYRKGCSGSNYGTCESCTCPSGQYSSACSQFSLTCAACTSCEAGKMVSGCSGSSPGFCSDCPSGTFALAGATACTDCKPGIDYSSSSGSSQCTPCTGGSCTGNSELVPCNRFANDYCQVCDKPDFSVYVSGCTWQCVTGYYKSGNQCFACTTYDPNPTSATETACAVGQYFRPCTADANGACVACTNFKPADSYYSTSSGMDSDNCAWACNAGFEKTWSTCQACGPGTYSSTPGTTCRECPKCPAGQWNNACGGANAGGGVAGCASCTNVS